MILADLRAMRTEMNQRLDRLVTTEAFAAEMRRVDDQFARVSKDLVVESKQRELEDAEIKSGLDRNAANIRWAFAAVVIPAAGLVTTIVLAMRGGA